MIAGRVSQRQLPGFGGAGAGFYIKVGCCFIHANSEFPAGTDGRLCLAFVVQGSAGFADRLGRAEATIGPFFVNRTGKVGGDFR